MRSAEECLAMAVDIERQASLSSTPSYRADLMSMAETWRHLAQQALWQDAQGHKVPRR